MNNGLLESHTTARPQRGRNRKVVAGTNKPETNKRQIIVTRIQITVKGLSTDLARRGNRDLRKLSTHPHVMYTNAFPVTSGPSLAPPALHGFDGKSPAIVGMVV